MSSLQKTILQKRLGSIDTDCPLCNEAKETVTHLFFECPITRLIWFGSCWSIRSDTFQVANCVDIVKLVLDPPNPSNDGDLKELSSLQFAFSLEAIWNMRNKATYVDAAVANSSLEAIWKDKQI